MNPANSEFLAAAAQQHAKEAKAAIDRYEHDGSPVLRLEAQMEMEYALVCAVLALRDTIREYGARR